MAKIYLDPNDFTSYLNNIQDESDEDLMARRGLSYKDIQQGAKIEPPPIPDRVKIFLEIII